MKEELEASYRRLLRLYPRSYRASREAEMLDVFVQSAPPDRTRPPASDVLDLARGAARAWSRRVFTADPLGIRNAAPLFTILLPLLHLGLATQVVARGLAWQWNSPSPSFGAFADFSWDWPSWALWSAAAAAAMAGKARIARLSALIAVALFPVLMVTAHGRYNHQTLSAGLMWIATGSLQVALLTPERLRRGRATLGRWLPGLALAALVGGAARGALPAFWGGSAWIAYNDDWKLLLVVLVAAAGLISMLLVAGRASAPWWGAALSASAVIRESQVMYYLDPGYGRRLLAQDVARLLFLPLLVFVALRLLAALATAGARRGSLGSGHD